MVCVPDDKEGTVRTAWPLALSGAEPIDTPLSKNVTNPVSGWGALGIVLVTVAVKVIAWPKFAGLGEPTARVVRVPARLSSTETELLAPLEVTKSGAPSLLKSAT